MTFIVEPIHIWWLVGLAMAFLGAITGLGRWLLGQFQKRVDDRFSILAADSQAWRAVERDLMVLRAELPERYVRREDYNRGQAVLESKQDALSAKQDALAAKVEAKQGAIEGKLDALAVSLRDIQMGPSRVIQRGN